MNNPTRAAERAGPVPLLRLWSTGPHARQACRILQRVKGQPTERKGWRRASQNSAVMAISANLARYPAEAVPDVDGAHPFLVRSIDKGLNGWCRGERSVHPSLHPLMGYIRWALCLLPQALEREVSRTDASGQLSVWEPLEQPISAWRTGSPALSARPFKRSQDTAYMVLMPADCRLTVLARFLWTRPLTLRSPGSGLDGLLLRHG